MMTNEVSELVIARVLERLTEKDLIVLSASIVEDTLKETYTISLTYKKPRVREV